MAAARHQKTTLVALIAVIAATTLIVLVGVATAQALGDTLQSHVSSAHAANVTAQTTGPAVLVEGQTTEPGQPLGELLGKCRPEAALGRVQFGEHLGHRLCLLAASIP